MLTRKRQCLTSSSLYKGINQELIDAIYDRLYQLSAESIPCPLTIQTHTELKGIKKNGYKRYDLQFYHHALRKGLQAAADFVILATGYRYDFPDFLGPLKSRIEWDAGGRYLVNRNYSVDDNNRIFVQNAEMHTHGFNAPDLGLGAYRNAVIINSILNRDYYPVHNHTCFQTFA